MLLDITYKHKLTWEETVAARDVLLNNSKISKILETEYKCGYLPLSRIIKANQSKEYSQDSIQFLTKIGLNKPFDLYIDSGKIMTSGKEIKKLSINEKRLLMLLIKNSNKVVGIDELNGVISNEMEKFSLYAVTKSIQRLRDKLEANGIPSTLIQTIREEGYMFKA
jgi:DNA-binding response OmpR family regulator